MSSATDQARVKIQNLEEQLIRHFSTNVISRRNVPKNHIENMCETGRAKKKNGFYLFTIMKTKESHGILVYKETQPNGQVIFYIYEPNGQQNINDSYNFSIDDGNPDTRLEDKLSNRMTPLKSINDYVGHCALWCIVVIILWNSFEPRDRLTALDLFHAKMLEKFGTRKDFIDSIYRLILDGRDFSTQSETEKFVKQVTAIIMALPIKI
jgi:hypothetical protein